MTNFLLVGGGSASACIDLLWVAQDLAAGDNAQVDLVAPAAVAPFVSFFPPARRVVAFAPPDLSAFDGLAELKPQTATDIKGWGRALAFAAQKAASSANANARAYWGMAADLRLQQYDIAFVFDSGAFAAAVSRLARATKLIGFDDKNAASAPAATRLLYHEAYHIAGKMSRAARCRNLAARHLGYTPPAAAGMPPPPAPANAPPAPFVATGGNIPPAFMRELQKANIATVAVDNMPPPQQLAFAANAAAAFGNGAVCAYAALTGKTAWFVGNERDLPEAGLLVSTPAVLREALQKLQNPPAAAAPAPPPPKLVLPPAGGGKGK